MADVNLFSTADPQMERLLILAKKAATKTRSPILITGETGVGKEELARTIHRIGPNANAPFVSMHCGAVPDGLVESALYGHEKGSFTGAQFRRIGVFEEADGGVLFLDEINQASDAFQVKLLKVLDRGLVRRVGGESEFAVDPRIIAATNQNLSDLVAKRKFREDLLYRLDVISLVVPPLRERVADIPGLVKYFLRKFSRPHSVDNLNIDDVVMRYLCNYNWRGNVRELRNVIEQMLVAADGEPLTVDHLPVRIKGNPVVVVKAKVSSVTVDISPEGANLGELHDDFQRQVITKILSVTGGNIAQAAKLLHTERRNLYRLIERFAIDVRIFRPADPDLDIPEVVQ